MNATFAGVVIAMLETAIAVIMGCNYYAIASRKTVPSPMLEKISGGTEQQIQPELLRAPYCMMGVFLGHLVGLLNWGLLATSVAGVVVLGAIWCKFLLPEALDGWQKTDDVPLLVFDVGSTLIAALAGYFIMFGVAMHKEPSFMLLAIGAACLAVMYTRWAKRLLQAVVELNNKGQLPRS